MPAVVIVECGRETRTAFVSDKDANGDERTEAAASIVAGFRVDSYILATGPMPDGDLRPALWSFPMNPLVDLHTHIARFQRRLGSGPHSARAAVFRAITATTRTIDPHEISAFLGKKQGAQPRPVKPSRKAKPAPPLAGPTPVQMSLF